MTDTEFRDRCVVSDTARRATVTEVRGQRLVLLASYAAAAICLGFATSSLVAGGPQTRIGLINLAMAAAFASVPSLRRLAPLAPAIGFWLVAMVALSVITVLLGTSAGMSLYFVIIAAGATMVVGVRRWPLILVAVLTSIAAVAILHLTVPATTGRVPEWFMRTGYIVNAAGACLLAVGIVGYGLLQIQRAEDALEQEYDRSEALLDNILPRSIAARLKDPAHEDIADAYDDASILFADIAGFTAMSSKTQPAEVVRFLNRLYTALDALVDRHGLEKIKTTGDSYMVVSGVPQPDPAHLEALALFALDMRAACEAVTTADGQRLPMRIGLACGPVVAGVVGSRKFFYDVWGDAVNLASRMESTGIPGRIQVTDEVRTRLAGRFELEERGAVEVKGKSEQQTWFLVGRALTTRPTDGTER
ncbi:adenylate/guanylate cyclase domain-containing protein [Gordonia sp. (in: high G+C Gram-positive bacteria)]|uniref:adenylate/guanylate cyclase domain-containing protein n=1 Tax=Gordonia sp. (in: high G+C Gram-positive bacteria) TaxID=84139 RepID=UPI0039E32777